MKRVTHHSWSVLPACLHLGTSAWRISLLVAFWALAPMCEAAVTVPKFGVHEVTITTTTRPSNPYIELSAEAVLTEPDGARTRVVPLFWDGGGAWRFRFSPGKTGGWKWMTRSGDAGLDGKAGGFEVIPSNHPGGLVPMGGYPNHFARQDGTPFWFLGDTAWALFTDDEREHHNRTAARHHLEARAAQGFNVVHTMLLSEAGWGNQGGPPWLDLAREELNPAYWQEVDTRVALANRLGLVCGLALAWGDKGRQERYPWHRFPSLEARHRYARYAAARYSAFDVYFLVSGEWHAEVTRRRTSEDPVRAEFFELGQTLRAADPHGRMAGIHPMTSQGSVREFNAAPWMSFGDYQQNYRDLHGRILESLRFGKPVVNSEYGYFLRDQNGDGKPDKDNSTSLESMRHATWDIAMAGGYVVTGFGTTCFGGNRDPGPFDVEAIKNKPWERQIGLVKRLFTSLEWCKLRPHDDLLTCFAPRGTDSVELGQTAPPRATWWCLAEPERQYVVYVRGTKEAVELTITGATLKRLQRFDPRTGELEDLGTTSGQARWRFQPPDTQDWVMVAKPK
jgi:hypothetical protein